jgi:hypothetical protein
MSNKNEFNIYCPCCGLVSNWLTKCVLIIFPGDTLRWTCPECMTTMNITFNFKESNETLP